MSLSRVLKVFGWVMAGFGALMGGITGYTFVTGGFKPPYIPPTGLYFISDNIIINEDTDIFVLPTPENATELDIQLSILEGSSIISVPQTAKMNEPITITVLKDNEDKNIGGVAKIRANQGVYIAECTVFVDVPVDSFELASDNEGGIYVGDTFNVSPTNIIPSNSLNPSYLNSNYNVDDKVINYYSSNEEVATVDLFTGEVTPIAEGDFTIEARVIKTYSLVDEQPNIEDFEYLEDYWLAMNEISTIAVKNFTVQSIEVVSMSLNDNELDPLYELYLHKTAIFTPEDFGLNLHPQPDSSFTSKQLDYKIKDLVITPSNSDVLQVVQTENPLTYEITVLEFETWEIYQPKINMYYAEGIEADIHFKILRNDIVGLTIGLNTPSAIELSIKESSAETYNLEANTTIIAEDETQPPTYETLLYQVDLTQSRNTLGDLIIDIDEDTGYVTDNVITALNRGTTRLRALVIETDIDGVPILDESGEFKVLANSAYVTVNILEELTSLQVEVKEYKEQECIVGESVQITFQNLTAEQITAYDADNLSIYSSDDAIVTIDSQVLTSNYITVNISSLQAGKANIIVKDLINGKMLDYIAIDVTDGSPVSSHTLAVDLNLPGINSFIMGKESFLIFTPNSQGAFIDAYKFGKIQFISTRSNKIQISSSIDQDNNIFVKLLAVGFEENPDGSFNAQESYSMIRASLIEDPEALFFNERINVDVGAVNRIVLHVNNQTITAVPGVGETQWLTPEDENLSVNVTFEDPDSPRVTGVFYYTDDANILEVNNDNIDEFGNPEFIFKKAGTVTLIAKSLDPYAVPTDPTSPEKGAYSEKILTINVPTLVTSFNYNNLTNHDNKDYEQVISGDAIDLLSPEIGPGLEPRVNVVQQPEGIELTDVIQFEIVEGMNVATLTEVLSGSRQINIETLPVGRKTQVTVRLFTDFGYEEFYYIELLPDVVATLTYPSDTNPEIVYPNLSNNPIIDLLDDSSGTKRVDVKDTFGIEVSNVKFEISSSDAFININTGQLSVFDVAVPTIIPIRIYITYATGIDFETYYYVQAVPNIEITALYENSVMYQEEDILVEYEEIYLDPTFDLKTKISASTIDPNDIRDISDTLNFSVQNDYVQVDSNTGVLSFITTPTEDQYITITVSTDYGYEINYNVKILTP